MLCCRSRFGTHPNCKRWSCPEAKGRVRAPPAKTNPKSVADPSLVQKGAPGFQKVAILGQKQRPHGTSTKNKTGTRIFAAGLRGEFLGSRTESDLLLPDWARQLNRLAAANDPRTFTKAMNGRSNPINILRRVNQSDQSVPKSK